MLFKKEATFCESIGIQYPIIQAPYAGHTSVDLVAAVSNAGGLGSLAAGMMSPDTLRENIRLIRKKTKNPFAVNIFGRPSRTSKLQLQEHYDTDTVLNQIRSELHIEPPSDYSSTLPPLEEQMAVLLEEHVPVVSFTFGLLPDNILQSFWKAGTYLIGTATTVEEAKALAGLCMSDPTRKADAIIAQGLEAGGYRGSFLRAGKDENTQEQTTERLVELIQSNFQRRVNKHPVPILAAGGISTGERVKHYLQKTDGVVLGTLFLLCTESATPAAHRKVLLNSKELKTKISNAWTGKSARGYPNRLSDQLEQANIDIPPFEIQSSKVKDIITFAAENNISDYMLLFSGTGADEAAAYSENGTLNASQIIEKIIKEL